MVSAESSSRLSGISTMASLRVIARQAGLFSSGGDDWEETVVFVDLEFAEPEDTGLERRVDSILILTRYDILVLTGLTVQLNSYCRLVNNRSV